LDQTCAYILDLVEETTKAPLQDPIREPDQIVVMLKRLPRPSYRGDGVDLARELEQFLGLAEEATKAHL